jgi:hypothetical protein
MNLLRLLILILKSMNRKNLLVLFIPIMVFLLLPKEEEKASKKVVSEIPPIKHHHVAHKKNTSEAAKVTLPIKQSPSTTKEIETIFRAQAGNSLKEVMIKRTDHFQWTHQGNTTEVESLIVTLKNQLNTTTTFRVLVDAQSGKIIQSWDHPILDPVNPRNNFKVRIDPRYHND